MSVVWGLLLVAGAVVVSIAALLLVRRRAPEEGFFTDGDRAAGVFGVLATGVAFLLGFVIFLAFESYDESRSGAETEALMVGQQVPTAQLLPAAVSARLTGELICYGRSVVSQEWPAMERGDARQHDQPVGASALFRTLEIARPGNAAEEAAYSKWLDQTSTREEGRLDRLHGAEGIIPGPVWLILFLSAGVIFVFMLFFADPSERPYVQAVLIGTVVAVLGSMFVVLAAPRQPVQRWPGQPAAGCHGADPRRDRRGAARGRQDRSDPVRRDGGRVVTEEKGRNWVELVATVLLSVATVATAWSAYQANRWNGEQAKAAGRANAARIESTRASGVANRQVQIDVALFTQFIDAFAQEQTELADFYRARFRDEFKPAFEAWAATKPRTNPDAPLTPFELPQYRLAANEEAERLEATPTSTRPRRAGTSSGARTTSSASCSSRRRSSSPG